MADKVVCNYDPLDLIKWIEEWLTWDKTLEDHKNLAKNVILEEKDKLTPDKLVNFIYLWSTNLRNFLIYQD